MVSLGIKIINHFPYQKNVSEYLAVFAALMTGNPHAFDEGTKTGQFFDSLVSFINPFHSFLFSIRVLDGVLILSRHSIHSV